MHMNDINHQYTISWTATLPSLSAESINTCPPTHQHNVTLRSNLTQIKETKFPTSEFRT